VSTTASGPTLTTDLAVAKADLDRHGYCLLEAVLDAGRLDAVRSRLADVAAAEIADGTDYVYENGANQRVWTLLNKGDVFVELVFEPPVFRLMGDLLGGGFLLSNIDANIAGPGGPPMFLHADQSFVPPPWPAYPLVANAMWMLDDFKPENGATRVVPGSHLLGFQPGFGTPPEGFSVDPVPVCAPAGSVMVFDGRLWHQTGANTTDDERRHGILAYYCRPFMRTQESWFLSIKPDVLERFPQLKSMIGYDNYLSLGMIDGMPRTGPRY
jgi:ectoine hydroxylase-related dioxygenase (phytanoyl-CoA dioxygenase family)